MVTFATLASDGQQLAAASYVTAAVNPAGGSALVVSVVTFHNTSAQPDISSIAGCGLTWTEVRSADHDTAGGDRGTTFLWKGVGTPSSGTITITFAGAVNRASWVVTQVTDCDAADPVVQSNFATVNAASAATTLAAFADPANATFICVGTQESGTANGFTPEAGYTPGGAWFGASFYHNYTAFLDGEDATPSGSFTSSRSAIIAAEIRAAGGAAPQSAAIQRIVAASALRTVGRSPGAVSRTVARLTSAATPRPVGASPGPVSTTIQRVLASAALRAPAAEPGAVTRGINRVVATVVVRDVSSEPGPVARAINRVAAATTVRSIEGAALATRLIQRITAGTALRTVQAEPGATQRQIARVEAAAMPRGLAAAAGPASRLIQRLVGTAVVRALGGTAIGQFFPLRDPVATLRTNPANAEVRANPANAVVRDNPASATIRETE